MSSASVSCLVFVFKCSQCPAEETTGQHGILGMGGRRINNPNANDRICSKANISATSSGDAAITIRFSPTDEAAP